MSIYGRLPEVSKVETWSPTRYLKLQRCGLEVAYSTDIQFRKEFDRGNEFTAMGTIAHSLSAFMEAGKYDGVPVEDLKNSLRAEWDSLGEVEHAKLRNSWLPMEPPKPLNWPKWQLRRAETVESLRRRQLRRNEVDESALVESRMLDGLMKQDTSDIRLRIEERLSDPSIKLVGTPDKVIINNGVAAIIDLKTSQPTEEIPSDYLTQLLLYAHLVSLNYEVKVNKIGIEIPSGGIKWHSIADQDISNQLGKFILDIEAFESAVAAKQSPLRLAQPSRDSCEFCRYRSVCPAYWAVEEDTVGFDQGVLGTVIEVSSKGFLLEVISPVSQVGEVNSISHDGSRSVDLYSTVSIVNTLRTGNNRSTNWKTIITQVSILSESSS